MSDEYAQWKTDQQFRLLIEVVTDYAIFLIDSSGKIVTWNPGAERLLGYAEAEIIGKDYSCLLRPRTLCEASPNKSCAPPAKRGARRTCAGTSARTALACGAMASSPP
jgi:PAS domain-containing protein